MDKGDDEPAEHEKEIHPQLSKVVAAAQQHLSGLTFREESGVINDHPQRGDTTEDLQAGKIGCSGLIGHLAPGL
jgi:hypothetical protein